MKVLKFLTGTTLIGVIAIMTFNITYEKVSATEMEKLKEQKKHEIVYRPITDTTIKDKKEESNDDSNQKSKLNVKSNNFIFIGDDRLDSLKYASMNLDVDYIKFINSKKADCDWMRNSGLSELNHTLNTTNLSYNIIFNPSINDLENIKRYVDFFNDLAIQHPNHNIFVLDVFPLDEAKLEDVKEKEAESQEIKLEYNIFNNFDDKDSNTADNDSIYKFNINLKKSLNENVHIIHAGQQLVCNEFETTNGYNLTNKTSTDLLNFIYKYIKDMQNQ